MEEDAKVLFNRGWSNVGGGLLCGSDWSYSEDKTLCKCCNKNELGSVDLYDFKILVTVIVNQFELVLAAFDRIYALMRVGRVIMLLWIHPAIQVLGC